MTERPEIKTKLLKLLIEWLKSDWNDWNND